MSSKATGYSGEVAVFLLSSPPAPLLPHRERDVLETQQKSPRDFLSMIRSCADRRSGYLATNCSVDCNWNPEFAL